MLSYLEVEMKLTAIAKPFKKVPTIRGSNFVTPIVVTTFSLPNGVVVELSYGRFIDHWNYGVTCSSGKDSKMFKDIGAVERHVNEVINND